MPPFATARDLLRRAAADAPGTTKLIREGRRSLLEGEGTHSLFAWPFAALARKLKGKEAVNAALYDKYHRPLKNLDEKAGRFIAEHTGAKKLFGQVDVLPTSRKMGGNRALIEHETHSVTAPLTKATKVVTPLAAVLWAADHLVGKDDEAKMAHDQQTVTDETAVDKDALLKEAGDLLEQAHRRERATKIAFSLVEQGRIPPFSSHAKFVEKIASIMTENLDIYEKALSLDGDNFSFGKVAEERQDGPVSSDATANFYHRLKAED